MEININAYFSNDVESHHISRLAYHGGNAWADATNQADSMDPRILSTDEQRQALKDHLKSMGMDDDVQGMSGQECEAAFLQLISGDINENEHLSDELQDWDWVAYEADEDTAGRMFKGIDDNIYYYLGE